MRPTPRDSLRDPSAPVFIAAAVAEKVGVLRTTAELLRERALQCKAGGFAALCARGAAGAAGGR
jgi:hypothetical protein